MQGRPLFTLMVQLAFTGKMLINSRMFALILLFTDLVSEAIKRVQNSGGISHWLTLKPDFDKYFTRLQGDCVTQVT